MQDWDRTIIIFFFCLCMLSDGRNKNVNKNQQNAFCADILLCLKIYIYSYSGSKGGVYTVPGSGPAPVARAGMAPVGCFPVPLRLWKMAAGRQAVGILGSSPRGPAECERRIYAMEPCEKTAF